MIAPPGSRMADKPCGREMTLLGNRTGRKRLDVYVCPRCDGPTGRHAK